MKLNEIRDNKGARKGKMRVGRGVGSGKGRTGGRGFKGQKARTGVAVNGFEGGQMPGYRQMPKLKGFKNFNAICYAEINVGDLANVQAKEITLESLIAEGKVCDKAVALRVLGNGELSKAVTVSARYFTETAKEKIEKAGGKAQLV